LLELYQSTRSLPQLDCAASDATCRTQHLPPSCNAACFESRVKSKQRTSALTAFVHDASTASHNIIVRPVTAIAIGVVDHTPGLKSLPKEKRAAIAEKIAGFIKSLPVVDKVFKIETHLHELDAIVAGYSTALAQCKAKIPAVSKCAGRALNGDALRHAILGIAVDAAMSAAGAHLADIGADLLSEEALKKGIAKYFGENLADAIKDGIKKKVHVPITAEKVAEEADKYLTNAKEEYSDSKSTCKRFWNFDVDVSLFGKAYDRLKSIFGGPPTTWQSACEAVARSTVQAEVWKEYDAHKGIPLKKKLNDYCESDAQCNGSEHQYCCVVGASGCVPIKPKTAGTCQVRGVVARALHAARRGF